MREIVLDTETTGLDPYQGHRLVEIGCVELVNRIPHRPAPSIAISIPSATCRPRPSRSTACRPSSSRTSRCFAEVADEFLEFVGDAPLVMHNATFDLGFLNAELERCGKALIARDRLVDTLLLARRKHPGAAEQPRSSVRTLCDRQFPAHQARRAARCRDPRRSLCRADRRPPGAARAGRGGQRRGRRLASVPPSSASARRRSCPASADRRPGRPPRIRRIAWDAGYLAGLSAGSIRARHPPRGRPRRERCQLAGCCGCVCSSAMR